MRYSYGVPVNPVRRTMAAVAGLAVLAAAGGVLAMPAPTSTATTCPTGESRDLVTGVCMPAPPTNLIEETTPAGGGPPEVAGVPCTGGNSYECIGLAEESQAAGPSPTATAVVGTSAAPPASAPPPDPEFGEPAPSSGVVAPGAQTPNVPTGSAVAATP